jgi:hypothetical protein
MGLVNGTVTHRLHFSESGLHFSGWISSSRRGPEAMTPTKIENLQQLEWLARSSTYFPLTPQQLVDLVRVAR